MISWLKFSTRRLCGRISEPLPSPRPPDQTGRVLTTIPAPGAGWDQGAHGPGRSWARLGLREPKKFSFGAAQEVSLHGGFVAMIMDMSADAHFHEMLSQAFIVQFDFDGPPEMRIAGEKTAQPLKQDPCCND